MAKTKFDQVYWGWIELVSSASGGGVSSTPGSSDWPSLAVDTLGRVYVAWQDATSGYPQVYLRRFEGNSWKELKGSASGGGASNAADGAGPPKVVTDVQGTPFVAWAEPLPSGFLKARLVRWTGLDWVELVHDATQPQTTDATSLRLALHPKTPGQLLNILCYEVTGAIHVKYWDGSKWNPLGPSGQGLGISGPDSLTPALAVNPVTGNVAVAWLYRPQGFWGDIHLKIWNSPKWEEVKGAAAGSTSASNGGVSNTKKAQMPSLAYDPKGNLYVAWLDHSYKYGAIYLKKWDGNNWTELDSSAQDGGLSETPNAPVYPSLAVNKKGEPIVTWAQYMGPPGVQYNIYVKRWNSDKQQWEGLGKSASGPGISNSLKDAYEPAMTLDNYEHPVVCWKDEQNLNTEIFLRQWAGPFINITGRLMLPPPASLIQYTLSEKSIVLPAAAGGRVWGSTTMIFSALLRTQEGKSGPRKRAKSCFLQVEVADRPRFRGVPTRQSHPVKPGDLAVVTVRYLRPGKKWWQARTVDDQGRASAWVAYGGQARVLPGFEIVSERSRRRALRR